MNEAVVIGGGIAGLTAAVVLGRAGVKTTLVEKSSGLGGRGATQVKEGYHLNLGAHAFYDGGEAMRVATALGLELKGKKPSAAGRALRDGKSYQIPSSFLSLFFGDLLGWRDRFQLAGFLSKIPRLRAGELDSFPVRDWLEREGLRLHVRQTAESLIRLGTYSNKPSELSAGIAVRQLQLALKYNVYYLDGGWQSFIEQLRTKAASTGVEILTAADAVTVETDGQGVSGVKLQGGRVLPASRLVIAAGPKEATHLVPQSGLLASWATQSILVKAAALDLVLNRLPRPETTFAIGMDEPVYYSVHTATAKLGPGGGSVVHLMKYLEPGTETDAHGDETQLEGVMDILQPGWREAVVFRRYLPKLVVTHRLVTAAGGGYAGRPGPQVGDTPGLFVAGDWVGSRGLLADASFASGEEAGLLAAGLSPAARAA